MLRSGPSRPGGGLPLVPDQSCSTGGVRVTSVLDTVHGYSLTSDSNAHVHPTLKQKNRTTSTSDRLPGWLACGGMMNNTLGRACGVVNYRCLATLLHLSWRAAAWSRAAPAPLRLQAERSLRLPPSFGHHTAQPRTCPNSVKVSWTQLSEKSP